MLRRRDAYDSLHERYDMTERQLTFIDVDENSLVLWLKEDRVQLRVVDSRPELEADELRAFASILFATYVGPPLAARLEAARAQLDGVRARLASGDAGERAAEVADIEHSLRAIEDVAAVIAGVRKLAPPAATAASAPARRPRKSGRGRRAGEGDPPEWGWVRHDRDDASAVPA
jgi:hypothetical protein